MLKVLGSPTCLAHSQAIKDATGPVATVVFCLSVNRNARKYIETEEAVGDVCSWPRPGIMSAELEKLLFGRS
jgi:hypothetical protein